MRGHGGIEAPIPSGLTQALNRVHGHIEIMFDMLDGNAILRQGKGLEAEADGEWMSDGIPMSGGAPGSSMAACAGGFMG